MGICVIDAGLKCLSVQCSDLFGLLGKLQIQALLEGLLADDSHQADDDTVDDDIGHLGGTDFQSDVTGGNAHGGNVVTLVTRALS